MIFPPKMVHKLALLIYFNATSPTAKGKVDVGVEIRRG